MRRSAPRYRQTATHRGRVSGCWVTFVKLYCGEVEVSLGLFGGVLGGDEIGGRALWLSKGTSAILKGAEE